MLDTDLITYLAKLSKIEIDETEKERLVSEMSAIVELMDTMNEVTMEGDENLNGEGVSLKDLRADEIVSSYDREVVLNNASHKKDGFFVVPKIME
ncbi:Asp-tRNA(Asn)/Glu-tRNA(Gln) amidotransferase subunit GatC [Cellulosilyticum sp. ST5]|uniref:Aspartyl/glutamyl-tRNA(Asn/Gln) amidotransferase subunit C n=1 Tax=Cellulosilyticum lentocellum (strain ATCC 49066 / DSM 5427 / NCIMB 11756 / RHM5) TaxID=642492 RepID=F2JNM5_CELLD|nr:MULTISPECIES: Asp-tRNA(Asn)/Glu-tRNA(Gln) amidotransferase subunit GatC [Cellulosilyticum]ADZ85914.1 Aspartyl/glutamyl-tRNA(Asn/Gln) amidotransferase subunit C [Cellulosilyticum lentocellum DSM 5427]QEH67406.1 Asp-tRNA(Asn)/Glu-tRNA(Gln) amidotransferase subunit GatC [Cellulosilyticum sp. WCF-2]